MLVELCAVARDLGVSGDDIRLGAHATEGHCREGQSPLQLRLMKIATFNPNNVNRRLPNLLRWLKDAKPDVVCLQELKCTDEAFPAAAISQAGYHAVWRGRGPGTASRSCRAGRSRS